MESKLAGLDSRAELGKAIKRKTLDIVSQFEDGDFPFRVGRTKDEFPGVVVGARMSRSEISVVDGFYVLAPRGLMLHAVVFEIVNSAFPAFPARAVLRHASPEEYADFEEKIKPVNEKLLSVLKDKKLKSAMQHAGDY